MNTTTQNEGAAGTYGLIDLAKLVSCGAVATLLESVREDTKLSVLGMANGWFSQTVDGLDLFCATDNGTPVTLQVELRRWLNGWIGCSVAEVGSTKVWAYAQTPSGEWIGL